MTKIQTNDTLIKSENSLNVDFNFRNELPSEDRNNKKLKAANRVKPISNNIDKRSKNANRLANNVTTNKPVIGKKTGFKPSILAVLIAAFPIENKTRKRYNQ